MTAQCHNVRQLPPSEEVWRQASHGEASPGKVCQVSSVPSAPILLRPPCDSTSSTALGPSSFPVIPKPTGPARVFPLSHSTLRMPEEQLHVWVPPGTLLSPPVCSTSLSPQAFEVVLLSLYRRGDQALGRLLRGSRIVPKPSTLPPPSLSLSGPLWAHEGPNYKTRGAPTSHFSRNNASGCSFTRTAGQ